MPRLTVYVHMVLLNFSVRSLTEYSDCCSIERTYREGKKIIIQSGVTYFRFITV